MKQTAHHLLYNISQHNHYYHIEGSLFPSYFALFIQFDIFYFILFYQCKDGELRMRARDRVRKCAVIAIVTLLFILWIRLGLVPHTTLLHLSQSLDEAHLTSSNMYYRGKCVWCLHSGYEILWTVNSEQ